MAYPNMDLQSLPTSIELRVGTDQAERALQLAYYQVWAGIQALHMIDELNLRPEQVVAAGDESTFDTNITNLVTDLVAAMVHFDAIWLMVP
jgi:hypothetical protein